MRLWKISVVRRSFLVGFYEGLFAKFFDPQLIVIVDHMTVTVFAYHIVKKVVLEIELPLTLTSEWAL